MQVEQSKRRGVSLNLVRKYDQTGSAHKPCCVLRHNPLAHLSNNRTIHVPWNLNPLILAQIYSEPEENNTNWKQGMNQSYSF